MKNLKVLFTVLCVLSTVGAWSTDLIGDFSKNALPTGWTTTGAKNTSYYQLGTAGQYILSPKFSAATGTVTVKFYAYVTGNNASSNCTLQGLDSKGNVVETKSVTCSSKSMTTKYPLTTWTLTNSSNNIEQVKFIYAKATSSNMRVQNVTITYTAGSTKTLVNFVSYISTINDHFCLL